MRYDPLGRLYEVVGTGNATRFVYDGDELIGEYNTAGAMLRRYLHGRGVDDPVMWFEGAGIAGTGINWLHRNHQSSTIGYSNGGGGGVQASMAGKKYL